MVQLHELIFRDAHQSLLATRLRTEDMLPVARKLDEVGFFSFEVWGGATFDVCIRYLDEDPWVRLNQMKQALPNTPLQMLERAMNVVGYRNYPDDIVRKFMHLAKKNGCDYFRIFDALNDLRNLKVPMEAAKAAGGQVQACLSYTTSPVHTVEYFVTRFQKLERMGADTLCLKDMAGMISPQAIHDIVRGCKEVGVKAPLDLHSHCTSGMTGMAYQRAAEAGIDILDTAMSPISGGTAAPATESVVAALRGTEWDTGYDLKLLIDCRKELLKVWDKYRHLHRFDALKVDPGVTLHQIPGGMLSNLIFQLEEQGARDKYRQVLQETEKVREELGYPPLVTPTSQVVGVQAVMNVLHGRYKVVTQETKEYCRGKYGAPPAPIDPKILKRVLGENWKDEIIDCRPSDLIAPQWDLRRKELEEIDGGALIGKEEDIMTYALYPRVGLKFLRGQAPAEFTSDQLPLPIDHPLTRAMVAASFGEHKDLYLETRPPEERSGPARIPTEFEVEVDGEAFEVKVNPTGGFMVAGAGGGGDAKPTDVEGGVKSSMQGTVLGLKVKVGDTILEGDLIMTMEAMKMEQEIKAEVAGQVKEIFVAEGDAVASGDLIMQVL